MRIIGDLHARQQTLAMLETTTGELANLTLMHEGSNVRKFYSSLPRPVRSRLRVQRQSSTSNPGTWENSLALLVTNVAPSDSA
jgi:hypothetical protein